MKFDSNSLKEAISTCLSIDQPLLHKQLRSIERAQRRRQGAKARADLMRLSEVIEVSRSRRERREKLRPQPQYPDELPICERRAEIADAIAAHQVVVICGETGSGKSTQLPKLCLELGRGASGMIGHTQPRRIAARSVAARLAEELNTEVGHVVGYKVRFSDRTHPDTYIKVVTDGMLLAELRQDPGLAAYDTLIIDEAHERSLNIDFLLGYLKQLLARRPELKLIITSATIDPERFSRHFDGAPVIEVSGRTYPVEVRYRPLGENGHAAEEGRLQQGVLDAVDELSQLGAGDMLVFMPGERDIRETAESLRKHHPPHTEIVPLFARLSAAEQSRVFRPHDGRRIVIATNVAETSLTVPGIHYVIDAGTARISRYSHRSKVQRLPIERISQASADQRAGRCGRVAAGVCIRLYSETEYSSAPTFTDPEIQRTNLASVILEMKTLRLGEIEAFPFVDPPDRRYINDGYKVLHEIGALDERRQLTKIGRRLIRLPLDPRIARMVFGAVDYQCLSEVLVIAAGLSVQDPRERPLDAQQAADKAHREFEDTRSDFIGYLNIWDAFNECYRHLSQNKMRKWCSERFLSYRRMREWRDIHRQLKIQIGEIGMRENQQPSDYASLHKALLTGLLGNIALLQEGREYHGARGNKLRLFPGSALVQRLPKWIVAAEIIETSKLYAHTVARIEPQWIEEVGSHLLKRSCFDPHWDARSGRVTAFERATLYGILVQPKRRVDYSRCNPREAREIFIRRALVEGGWNGRAEFIPHNRGLIATVKQLEDKTRRNDIMSAPEVLYRFYDERVPEGISDVRRFERWYRQAANADAQLLHMTTDMLMRRDANEVTEAQYPATLNVDGMTFPLSYRFSPGEPDDGVTMTVPLAALNQVDATRAQWLVPGMLHEKIVALIKSLPKRLRRHFVPAADFADACWGALQAREDPEKTSLIDALTAHLRRMTGVAVPLAAWQVERLPGHLVMKFRIVDDSGACVAIGSDIALLQAELGERARSGFARQPANGIEREGVVDWDFGDLPRTIEVGRQGTAVKGFPALVDQRESISVAVFDNRERAEAQHRAGVRRLFGLAVADKIKYIRKNLPGMERMCLHYAPVGRCDELRDDLIDAAVDRVFVQGAELPRSERAFRERVEAGAPHLVSAANELCTLVDQVLTEYHGVKRRLSRPLSPLYLESISDMKDQLEHLVYAGFLIRTPARWLCHYPRYLKAMGARLDDLPERPARDKERGRQIGPFWEECKARMERAGHAPDAGLERFRWLLEEFRVSLFAQRLGTAEPVSAKRLERCLETAGTP